ncbi:hypothetical protein RB614_25030 [Phytohabitans sp. ZYX-F-186]|uniref:DUF2244 domain-containing protein n=1 Tax=Phytohabitans maris TaxID=3071409 RepID=A0ABU0ZNF6_9ACTN|nr:hypothetical protein [Phytohabitans sp. ZYX-F-186]MDQ7907790.1 hypothetical protein [Phytohabitans sp. ZYX-F-186]
MELHRKGWTDRSLALKGMGVGAVGLLIAAFGLLIGGPLGGYLVVFAGIGGVFLILVGLLVFALSMRPFRISFGESGVSVHCEGLRFEAGWEQVEAINIERMPTPTERHMLVMWLSDDVRTGEQPTFPPGAARKGYAVVEMDQLRESREEVAALVNQYAGPKFRSGVHQ